MQLLLFGFMLYPSFIWNKFGHRINLPTNVSHVEFQRFKTEFAINAIIHSDSNGAAVTVRKKDYRPEMDAFLLKLAARQKAE